MSVSRRTLPYVHTTKNPEVVALFVRTSRLPSASNKEEIGVLNKDVLGPLYNQPENILLVLP